MSQTSAKVILKRSVETIVHALAVADITGDGRADIVTARVHQGDPPQDVPVHVNSGRGRSWTKEIIGDATVADAILDRLVHNAYRLNGSKSAPLSG